MSLRSSSTFLRARLVALALLTLLGMSCASSSPTAPSGSTLTLSTPTRSVSTNGTAVFTAQLMTGAGQPMVGASVTFTTTLGTIEPAQTVTNGVGQATAVLSAGTASGTAVVSASSGSARALPLNLVVGTAAVGRVALTASPAAVPFSGGTSTITAVVTDAAGNPLKSMPVGFTTTTGNVTPANAKTDTNGIVQTALTTAAAATVTAVAGVSPVDTGGTPTSSITGSVTVGLAPRPVPVVSITASGSPVAGSPVTFTIGATPAPGTTSAIQSVLVTFGDGDRVNLGAVTGTAIAVQHVYAAGGTYTVTMTATDNAGGTATASTVIVVRAMAPMAVSIVAGPMVPAGGGPKAIVAFTATVIPATAVITSYVWDFGDGSAPQTTTGNQVQHVFANAGLYTVTVTVTEALTERTAVGSVPVSTASGMPTVSVTASANPVAGRATTFTIAATVAPGSSVTMQNVRVTFGDGTPPVDLGGVTGSAITAGHVYASAGTYLASVTATDSAGGTATASTQVVVAAAGAPSVSIMVGANPLAGTPTTFTINAVPAAGGGTTIQNVQVTFGDGTAPVDLGAVNGPATTQHVYAAGGNYTVSATATDSGGVTATASTQAVVAAPGAPTVSITASANPVAGTATTFTVTAAPAPGSSTTVQNVRVTFGDGTAPVDLGAVSSSATTQHVYAAAGSYTVSVTATASNAATGTSSVQVVVAAPGAPTVSVTASANPVAGVATTFTISAAPAPGSNTTIQNVRVTFGDGAPAVDLGAVSGSTTTQHVFAAAGSYTVSVTATASNGATASASTQAVVAAPGAPTVSVTVGANPQAGTPATFTISAAPAPGSNTTIQNVRVTFGDNTAPVDLGAVSNSTTTQHVYAAAGSYTVSVTATASSGATATASTQAVVAAAGAPAVSVTAGPNPVAGTATTFTVTAAPAPGSNTTVQNVRVAFGDGTPAVDLGAVSNSATTQHVYAAAGSYTVSVTATASNGAMGTASVQVVVAAPGAPTVSVTASASPVAGTVTTFTVTAAPAPGSNTTIQSVRVNFGDGTPTVDLGAVSNSTTTQHSYAAAGSFTVSATATAANGATATASTQVVVAAPGSPTVSVTVSARPVAGTPTIFTITAAPAPGTSATIQNVQVTFGDGTPPVNLGAVGSATTQHVYAVGTFNASVTATASNGGTATVTTQVVVAAPPSPSVSISASANPTTGRATTFTITTATAPGSNATIQNVRVNFGDSTAPADLGAVGSTATTQHVYGAPGTFSVSATATDTGGGTATSNTTVVVAAAASVALVVSANPVAATPANFTVTVTPTAGVTIQNVTLRYGDGTQDDLGMLSGAPVVKAHTYSVGGPFMPSVSVTITGGSAALITTINIVVADFHRFSITSSPSATLHRWPGGTQSFTFRPGFSVTIRNPSGTISDLSGDTWVLVSATGYSTSNCSLTPRVPTCNGLGSSSGLLSNGRPWCSNSSEVFGSASTATADVTCR
jgi:PKD repeat protein